MKITFHGGAKEVGRSCYEVKTSKLKLLLDCGLKITPEGTEYPKGPKEVKDIDAVFITHAHLDHTGALPWMEHRGMDCPVYSTKATKALTRILLKDAFKVGKIQNHHLGYEKKDIKDVLKIMKRVKVKEEGEIDGVKFEFYNAGHIPGSASIHLDIEDKGEKKRILYTGDTKTEDTRLHKGGVLEVPDVDVLICETTYGDRDHPRREKTEKEFLRSVKEGLQRGGSVIVPVFAVGRAQEMIMVLMQENFKVPIFLDGMGIRVTDTILDNPSSIKDNKALMKAFEKVKVVKGRFERRKAIRRKGIFVTTSGMLTGGPIMDYLKAMHADEKNSILLTGYQGEGTNGRLLLETGNIYIDGVLTKIRCEVKKFDFSAHDGQAQLKEIFRKTRPKKVIFVHGDEKPCLAMQEWASMLGYESYAPKIGDTIEI